MFRQIVYLGGEIKRNALLRDRLKEEVLPIIIMFPVIAMLIAWTSNARVGESYTLASMIFLMWIPFVVAQTKMTIFQVKKGLPSFYERLKSDMGLIWLVYENTVIGGQGLMLMALEMYLLALVALVRGSLNGEWAMFKESMFLLLACLFLGLTGKGIAALLRKKKTELV